MKAGRSSGLALALALALAGQTTATSAVPLTLAQQAQKAAVIVRGTLGTATTVKEGDVTYTVYPLTVVETVAGDVGSLPQNAGQPSLFFLQGAQDLPTPLQQEAFLFLYTQKMDSPLVGYSQGFYPVSNGVVRTWNSVAGTGTGGAAPGTATTVAPVTANIESDAVKFRAAVLAARGSK